MTILRAQGRGNPSARLRRELERRKRFSRDNRRHQSEPGEHRGDARGLEQGPPGDSLPGRRGRAGHRSSSRPRGRRRTSARREVNHDLRRSVPAQVSRAEIHRTGLLRRHPAGVRLPPRLAQREDEAPRTARSKQRFPTQFCG